MALLVERKRGGTTRSDKYAAPADRRPVCRWEA
jgi:hypothetical protein